MTATLDALLGWLADRLAVGTIEGIVLVGLVWLVCRRVRLSAAMQTLLWWVVALKLVLVFLPLPAVRLALLPAHPVAVSSSQPAGNLDATDTSSARGDAPPAWDGIRLVVGAWLLGVAWHIVQLAWAWRRTRLFLRCSLPSSEDAEHAARLAEIVGLRRMPSIHTSAHVSAPLVVGITRPVVVMPADSGLSGRDRSMALGHEFMHIRRHDLPLGWIPSVAERLFYFHPFVQLAAREYITAREAACDAALVRALEIAPPDYARLLIRFGITRERTAWAAGGASRSASSLRRRLDMLHQASSGSSRLAGAVACAAIAAVLVPTQLVARSPRVPVPPVVAAAIATPAAPGVTALAPQEPTREEPSVAREQPANTDSDRVSTEQVLRQRLMELERALQDRETEVAQAAQIRDAQEIRRQIEREKVLEDRNQEAERLAAQVERESRAQLAREFAEMEKQVVESNRLRARLDGGALLNDQADIAKREILLRQQVEDLSQRLQQMADMQRELERAVNLLKRQLNAVK